MRIATVLLSWPGLTLPLAGAEHVCSVQYAAGSADPGRRTFLHVDMGHWLLIIVRLGSL